MKGMTDSKKWFRRFGIVLAIITTVGECAVLNAQTCPDGMVYIFGNPIRVFDPNQPLSAGNPVNTAIVPPVGSALAFGPNINSAFPSPTFYAINNGFYHYWNGTGWTNTNHTPGNALASNIAVGPGCLYNLVGPSGQVYSYNGTANGTLLFTIPGFSGGGPYDLVTDNCCNIYVLKSTVPQSLSVYDPSGNLIASCSLANLPAVVAGTGFAIAGNKVVVYNSSGIYVGTTGSSVVTFTYVGANFGGGGSDLGSCPVDCNTACSVPLPIEFEWLRCSEGKGKYFIEWKMQSQDDMQFYDIEESTNATDFKTIGTLNKENDRNYYKYTISQSEYGGIKYYRIKAVENNGNVKYSRICALKGEIGIESRMLLFPNPCTESFEIRIGEEKITRVEVKIFDKLGNIWLNKAFDLTADKESLLVEADHLPPGMYSVSLTMGNGDCINQKLVKMSN